MNNIINSTSKHLIVAPSPTYVPNSGQSAGIVRYNTVLQVMEVYDGISWRPIANHISIGMTYEAEQALVWATEKMKEEKELKEKLEKFPTLKEAYEQFKIIEALVINYEEEN